MTAQPHGSHFIYTSGCRCQVCCCEENRRSKASYARKVGHPVRGPARHGTRSKYVMGCRCGPCVEANKRYFSTIRNISQVSKTVQLQSVKKLAVSARAGSGK